jgi:integrase
MVRLTKAGLRFRPTKYKQSVDRLSDEDRRELVEAFRADPDSLASRVTHFLYSTGAHPIVISDPEIFNLRIQGGLLTWRRPKTDQEVNVPIDPEIAPWLPGFIKERKARPIHRVVLNLLVHRFGEWAGLPEITPRTMRHDFSFRALESQGLLAARAMTGTTTRTFLGYAGSKRSKESALKAAAAPNGLFGPPPS